MNVAREYMNEVSSQRYDDGCKSQMDSEMKVTETRKACSKKELKGCDCPSQPSTLSVNHEYPKV